MGADAARYLDLLEQRLSLFASLATGLTAARTDLVALDLTGLEARIADQERLCQDISALDLQLARLQDQCATHIRSSSTQSASSLTNEESTRREAILTSLTRAQENVRRLNREHQALLRRSRRTVSALLNSYHSFAATYANPAASGVSAGEGR